MAGEMTQSDFSSDLLSEKKPLCVFIQEVARGCHKVYVTGQLFLSSSSKAEVFPNGSDGCSSLLHRVGSRAGRMLRSGQEGNRGAADGDFSSRTNSQGLGASEQVQLQTGWLLLVAGLLLSPFFPSR